MPRHLEALMVHPSFASKYTNADPATVPRAATISELEALGKLEGVTLVKYESDGLDGRPIRYNGSVLLEGADDTAADEELYVAIRADYGADAPSYETYKVGDIVWTAGTTLVPASVGGDGSFVFPKSAAFASSGYVEAIGGDIPIGEFSAEPALVSIYDIGPIAYVISVLSLDDADAVVHRHARWS